MITISSFTSKDISFYRTINHFERYGDVRSVEEFKEYCAWAEANQVNIYTVGNGSNTLFVNKSVKSLVLKNKLDQFIKPLPEHRLEVSSSVNVSEILKYCYENSLDSFYYLASVPATVGGALAMNAGRGQKYGVTIYDFVESVTFFEAGQIKTLDVTEIKRGYRETIFTGIHSRFILTAVFKFLPKQFTLSPILERRKWAKEHQDNVGPNCGSVFKSGCYPILYAVRGLRIGKAYFSTKTCNWILNQSNNSTDIMTLIRITKLLHYLMCQKATLEIILVR
jgi:UDP-N-acetylmuramate dehydrogenase